MSLGMEVGIGAGDFVLDGDMGTQLPLPKKVAVGLGPGDFVLDGDPAPPPKRGQSPPIFGPRLLRPNGWMDEAGTWHGGRSQSRRLCVR